jgi:hypothetical protein
VVEGEAGAAAVVAAVVAVAAAAAGGEAHKAVYSLYPELEIPGPAATPGLFCVFRIMGEGQVMQKLF